MRLYSRDANGSWLPWNSPRAPSRAMKATIPNATRRAESLQPCVRFAETWRVRAHQPVRSAASANGSGGQAAYRRRPSLRYTTEGYSIHHVVSVGWVVLHEKHVAGLTQGSPASTRLLPQWPPRLRRESNKQTRVLREGVGSNPGKQFLDVGSD